MHKRIAEIAIAVIATIALGGCAGKQPQTEAHLEVIPAVTITDQDNGKSIDMGKSHTLQVRLPSNPTTGYQWVLQGNPAPLQLLTSDFPSEPQTRNAMGLGGTQTIILLAKSAGTATLRLEYRRVWEKDVPAAKTFSVTVIVN